MAVATAVRPVPRSEDAGVEPPEPDPSLLAALEPQHCNEALSRMAQVVAPLAESVASVNKRNSKFYFCSRYLRELVTYYGCIGHKKIKAKNGRESGPFYTGMSIVLNLPQFKMGLQGLCLLC